MKELIKTRLAEIYNNSDLDALTYMYQFCNDEQKELCEYLVMLYNETDLGSGRESATEEEEKRYIDGKWKLLNSFNVYCDDKGFPYIKEREVV